MIDTDGWLHTGDIGVMNADGYNAITDRLNDMFINGGFNVYPAEIEALLLDHRDVGQVAVVGVSDARLGELGYAFVVAAAPSDPDSEEILGWCRGRMASYKVPRHVEFVDRLPLNASGKLLKYKLRERAESVVSTDG